MAACDIIAVARKVRHAEPRAVARALSVVENGDTIGSDMLHILFESGSVSGTVGVTGPPGAGKSTLVNRLISIWRQKNKRVGIIAVDPSSPFSGGALLGDRLRMQSHANDPDVFIRSMSNRGHLGGLSGATRDAATVLAAAGYDPIVLETVGVGQAEVEVADVADITLLVLVPGLGDEVQTMKAGIMEIADIIVLNKADRQGIDQLETAVRASLELIPDGTRRPPVIRCSAQTGEGLEELEKKIGDLLVTEKESEKGKRRRLLKTLDGVLSEKGVIFGALLLNKLYESREAAVDGILAGETSPYRIGKELIRTGEDILEKADENEHKGN